MSYTGGLGSLVQGISQQSPRNRVDGQHTNYMNMYCNPVDGLQKRPPCEYLADMFQSGMDWAWFDITVDNQDFLLAVRNGDIRAFDSNGDIKPVTMEQGTASYLFGTDFSVAELDKKVYVVNKNATVTMRTDTFTDYPKDVAVVYCLGGQYGREYKLQVDCEAGSLTVTHTAPDGSTASHSEEITSTAIITGIKSALETHPDYDAFGLFVEQQSDVLVIRYDEGYAGTRNLKAVKVDDGQAGTTTKAIMGTVGDISDLPRFAPQGMTVLVQGDDASGDDDYYMRFDTVESGVGTGQGFGKDGYWLEWIAPDEKLGFDRSTMPHVLEYNGTTFTFKRGDWKDRRVGSSKTVKEPSFVGQKIRDIGGFQNRLLLVAGPSVIGSRTNEHDDFFKQSATALVETDPVDFRSTVEGVKSLERLVPHNRDMVIFSEKAQFVIPGRSALTPQNAAMVFSTAFESILEAAPVPVGKNVFFAFESGKHSGVKEFFTEAGTDANNSRPTTDHVPKLIEGRAFRLAASDTFNLLVVQTKKDRRRLYAYKYLWTGDEKQQSAWMTWVYEDPIVFSTFRAGYMLTVHRRGDWHFMCKTALDTPPDSAGFIVYLDYKVKVDSVAHGVDLPHSFYADVDIGDWVVVQGEGCPNPGHTVKVLNRVSNSLTLEADMQGGEVYVGIPFYAEFMPTMPFVKDRNGKVVVGANLVVSRFTLSFETTGYIGAYTKSDHRSTASVSFNGRTIGASLPPLGGPAVSDGEFDIPFGEDSTYAELLIFAEDYRPLNILDINYRGQIRRRGTRITG